MQKRLIDYLIASADSDKGITFAGEMEDVFVSYRKLLETGYGISRKLYDCGFRQEDKVIIYCKDMINFVYGYWSCIIGGYTAVPIDVKNDVSENFFDSRFNENSYILTDFSTNLEHTGMKVINICEHICRQVWSSECVAGSTDIIYIQYSSGTTSKTKGVMVREKNLIADVMGLIDRMQVTSDDVFFSWQPLTHCYGMITYHIVPLVVGCNQYLMPTELFMTKPLLWAQNASRYKATMLGMIPFAMKHFVDVERKSQGCLDVDLSGIKGILVGGELVANSVCNDFTQCLSKYGLNNNALMPAYGLAECVTIASLAEVGDEVKHYRLKYTDIQIGKTPEFCTDAQEGMDVVAIGKPLNGITINIKDDNGVLLPEGKIGNVNVQGDIVAAGYYEGRESDENIFLEDGSVETGDIGFIMNDALVIIGRQKEIVVKYGKKYLCSDLENFIKKNVSLEAECKVIACSGFSKDKQVEEVVIFVEDMSRNIERDMYLEREIKDKLYSNLGLSADYVIFTSDIPVTYSGKIKRLELMSRFVTNKEKYLLDFQKNRVEKYTGGVEQKKVADSISNLIFELLGIRISDYEAPFKDYGIVSVNIPLIIKGINELFDITVQPSELFNHPNVNEFAKFIMNTLNESENPVKKERHMNNTNNAEKIAIVGMSCRFPGGANSISEFWDILYNGKDGICTMPESRWNLEKYYSEDNAPGKMYVKNGGFLNVPIDEFDAKFFNISPKESVAMDPQQRLLLELVWESFENANIRISDYQGTDTGVFLGLSTDEYSLTHVYSGELDRIDAYSLTGKCPSTACGRVSYTFGFHGPCIAIDTACSSALTALHYACNSVLAKETGMAVVAGVNLNLTPVTNIAFSKLQATSKDGHSKAFDESANGYGRGEGGGVLLLKSLEDAQRDGNHILGVICGSYLNQDGKSNGLTAPNGEAQKKLIEATLKKSGVRPEDVDYIEMHGTGTKLGDPIEVNAVIDTYCKNRNNVLKIGSVKSNIGHLEAAAGIASIIKTLLAFRHDVIPGNLHFNNPNPFINWDKAPIEVVAKNTEWKKEKGLRRVGINGFGFGGSNAHVIIEEYKAPVERDNKEENIFSNILKLSTKSEKSLKAYAAEYYEYLKNVNEEEFSNIIALANSTKEDFEYRLCIHFKNKQELLDKLKDFSEGEENFGVFTSMEKNSPIKANRKFVFMFTGQGSQYVNMGRELYESSKVFRDCMDECNKLFKPLILQSITNLLYSENAQEEIVGRTVNAQPLIFSIEYSLAQMWGAIGVEPSVVVGHSIGEYAAAVTAGILNLSDAVKMVAIRGRLMDSVTEPGTMASILATEEVVLEMIADYKDSVSVAVVNSENNCVISGKVKDVETIIAKAQTNGFSVKQLKVSQGFHSVLMNSVLDEFEELVSDIKPNEAKIPFMSALYARELMEGEKLDAHYWARHIAEKVSFYKTVKAIKNSEEYIFVEIGAHTVLSSICRDIFGTEKVIVGSMRMRISDITQLSNAIAEIYANGGEIKWDVLCGTIEHADEFLPTYPFERTKFWQEPLYDRHAVGRTVVNDKNYNKLLGEKIESLALGDKVFYKSLFTSTTPYFMGEHIIFDTAISPAAAHVSLLLSAANDLKKPKSVCISNMEMRQPLAVTDDEEREVQLILGNKELDNSTYEIVSCDNEDGHNGWVSHTYGQISVDDEYFTTDRIFDIGRANSLEMDNDSNEIVYDSMSETGFNLGIGFRRITKNYLQDGEGICLIEPLKTIPDLEIYELYPGVIDSLFQSMLCIHYKALMNSGQAIEDKTIIPYHIGSVKYNYIPSDKLWACIDISKKDNTLYGNVTAFNEKGEVVVEIGNFMAQFTTSDVLLKSVKSARSKFKYAPVWKERKKGLKTDDRNNDYVIISEKSKIAEEVLSELIKNNKNAVGIIADEKLEDHINELTVGNNDIKFVYFVSSDSNESDKPSIRSLYEAKKFVKNLGESKLARKSSIKFVTTNVHSDNTQNLADAPIWGFAKVVSMEYINLYDGIVDVESDTPVSALMNEVIYGTADETRLDKEGKAYNNILVRVSNEDEVSKFVDKEIVINDNASYMVTGGNGAVGLVYARALVEKGAKYLYIMGRSMLSANASKFVEECKEQGISVSFVKADVCDYESVKQGFSSIKTDAYPPLKGIIHAAGVLKDGMISELEWDDYEKVLSPKIAGAWNLFKNIEAQEVDFFIMTSSITSVLGNMGQSNYAAANYFMNEFALWMQSQGVKAYAMCWGPWEDGGMASAENKDATVAMQSLGIKKLATESGLQLIHDFLDKPYANIFVADIDWVKLAGNISGKGKKTLLSEVARVALKDDTKEEEVKSRFLDELKQLTAEQRKYALSEQMKKHCAQILGFDDADSVSTELSLREQGADSLMLFQTRTSISKLLNIEIDIAVLYNYVSIDALSEYLLSEVVLLDDEKKQMAQEVIVTDSEFEDVSEDAAGVDYVLGDDTEVLFNQLKELI